MDEPAQSVAEGPASSLARWAGALPPPPFVNTSAGPEESRFAPLSPRVVVLIAAAVIAGLVLWMARDSIRPFILGLLFVYLLDPPVRWLVRRGIRRTFAILIVYVVGIVLFIEFLALTLTPLVNEIIRFVNDFPKLADSLDLQLQRLGEFYARLQIPVALRDWIDSLIAGIGKGGGGGGGGANLSFLLPLVTGASSLLGALFAYFILPVWVAYILNDKNTLVATFDRSLPKTWRFDTWAVIKTVERDFGQWVRGQILLGFAVGIATFVGLIVLSNVVDPIFGRYALLLSVIAGLFELVPIIGPIVSAVPAVLLAATVGPVAVLAALLLYFLVQQVENNFLVPKIQGNAVQLHPAAVVFAIIIGGSLAGLLGAILALPVTAAFRDVVRYLFRRLSPDEPEALAISLSNIGMGPDDA
ncbi:MAG: AI-2E family transporter [Chloroflexota bacterium]